MYHVIFHYAEGGGNHLVFDELTEALDAIAVHHEMGETTSPHKALLRVVIMPE